MLGNKLTDCHIILASQSPRRQFLLREIGLDFDVVVPDVDETVPEGMAPEEVAVHIARLKAESMRILPGANDLIITADTIVAIGDEILGKPADRAEAVAMLQKLSGRRHIVVTGVCLKSADRESCFRVTSTVWFKDLTMEEITYYIDNFHPFDKAGSYGAQEWIGYVAISRIEGSYFNVMGLPVKELYEELLSFCGNNS